MCNFLNESSKIQLQLAQKAEVRNRFLGEVVEILRKNNEDMDKETTPEEEKF